MLAQRGDPRIGTAYVPGDRVSAKAFAGFSEAWVITVPPETDVTEPTVISVRGHDSAGVAFGHTTVRSRA